MRVDDVNDVVRAADVAKVLTDTLAQVHPTIASPLYQHQIVCRVALGAKILRLTDNMFGRIYTRANNKKLG